VSIWCAQVLPTNLAKDDKKTLLVEMIQVASPPTPTTSLSLGLLTGKITTYMWLSFAAAGLLINAGISCSRAVD